MKNDNRLVFNVYDYDDVVIMNVKCIEGEGLTIFIHEAYEDFAENAYALFRPWCCLAPLRLLGGRNGTASWLG